MFIKCCKLLFKIRIPNLSVQSRSVTNTSGSVGTNHHNYFAYLVVIKYKETKRKYKRSSACHVLNSNIS